MAVCQWLSDWIRWHKHLLFLFLLLWFHFSDFAFLTNLLSYFFFKFLNDFLLWLFTYWLCLIRFNSGRKNHVDINLISLRIPCHCWHLNKLKRLSACLILLFFQQFWAHLIGRPLSLVCVHEILGRVRINLEVVLDHYLLRHFWLRLEFIFCF
jgi:hypothetical protein